MCTIHKQAFIQLALSFSRLTFSRPHPLPSPFDRHAELFKISSATKEKRKKKKNTENEAKTRQNKRKKKKRRREEEEERRSLALDTGIGGSSRRRLTKSKSLRAMRVPFPKRSRCKTAPPTKRGLENSQNRLSGSDRRLATPL